MKRAIICGIMLVALTTVGFAQSASPDCSNNNGLEGRINGIESSGWKEVYRTFYPVLYKVSPEPPYLIGSLEIVFGRDCREGEACTEELRLYREDAWQISQNTCVWQPGNH